MAGLFAPHVVVRKPVQLCVNEGGQLVECGLVAVAPGDQQMRDVLGRLYRHKAVYRGSAMGVSGGRA